MMLKPKLIIIEGFDRIGKDSFADDLMLSCELEDIPLRDLRKETKHLEIPSYHDSEAFGKFLDAGFLLITSALLNNKKNSIIVRWAASECTYSELLNRSSRHSLLNPASVLEEYDVVTFFLTFSNYDEYLKRCSVCDFEVQYTEEEFERINSVLLENIRKYSNRYETWYFNAEWDSEEEILCDLIESILLEFKSIELLEDISDIQHSIWSHWMNYLFSISTENSDGSVTIPVDKVERWKKQVQTKYRDLSESEKKSDRDQALKIFKTFDDFSKKISS